MPETVSNGQQFKKILKIWASGIDSPSWERNFDTYLQIKETKRISQVLKMTWPSGPSCSSSSRWCWSTGSGPQTPNCFPPAASGRWPMPENQISRGFKCYKCNKSYQGHKPDLLFYHDISLGTFFGPLYFIHCEVEGSSRVRNPAATCSAS